MSTWPNRVAIGDFVADNDAADFRLTVNLTGWDDGAPVRSGISSRAQNDGAWDGSGFADARVIGVEGMCEQPTAAAAAAVKDQLTALSLRSMHEMVVDNEATGTRSALVRVTKGAIVGWLDDTAFTYTLEVTAPDPLKYGAQTVGATTLASSAGGTGRVWPRAWPTSYGLAPGVVAGAVPLANAGTAPYFPTIRLDGGLTNPVITLTETGDWLRYNGTLTAGNWLDIDCGSRRVTFNSQVSHRHLVTFSGSWLSVPVGGGSVSLSADAYTSTHGITVWGYEGAWS